MIRPSETAAFGSRLAAIDWESVMIDLEEFGHTTTGVLLDARQCQLLIDLYAEETLFRKQVLLHQQGYGQGEYRYFAYPLPAVIAELRAGLYAPLAQLANGWAERLGKAVRYPPTHAEFIARCHAAGQPKPTPLLLRYQAGDFNCLHQDLYGETLFPLQVVFQLNEPGVDFDGGEFLLVEQQARKQSRAHVVPISRGEAVIFASHERPQIGPRRTSRISVRHGVATVWQGQRMTLGIIFHDAQ